MVRAHCRIDCRLAEEVRRGRFEDSDDHILAVVGVVAVGGEGSEMCDSHNAQRHGDVTSQSRLSAVRDAVTRQSILHPPSSTTVSVLSSLRTFRFILYCETID